MLSLLAACNAQDELTAASTITSSKRVWVHAQLNVPEEGDVIDSYWYYGRVPEQLVDLISANEIKQGYISFEDVKYWGNDDKLYDYEDDNFTGELVFRIEHIEKLTVLKQEPDFSGQSNEDSDQTPQEETEQEETSIEREPLAPSAPEVSG